MRQVLRLPVALLSCPTHQLVPDILLISAVYMLSPVPFPARPLVKNSQFRL